MTFCASSIEVLTEKRRIDSSGSILARTGIDMQMRRAAA